MYLRLNRFCPFYFCIVFGLALTKTSIIDFVIICEFIMIAAAMERNLLNTLEFSVKLGANQGQSMPYVAT